MRRERRRTLRPTALVHEAYFRQPQETWQNLVQFAVAAKRMRRVLVDHARRHEAVKGRGLAAGDPDEGLASTGPRDLDVWPWKAPCASSPSLIRRGPAGQPAFFGGLGLEAPRSPAGVGVR
jgi:hypothetical protein